MINLLTANAISIPLADGVVQTCITSPPYWRLRDYGVAAQLGLEQSPNDYISNMVNVFREVRRVLRDDGTLWLNIGDSYASANPRGGGWGDQGDLSTGLHGELIPERDWSEWNLKSKDLAGIPWRLAFALQQDGWYLRSDIIWAKPNPIPESVKDRPTKAHEYLFLLAKSEKYFFDHVAIKEPSVDPDDNRKLRSSDMDKVVPVSTSGTARPSGMRAGSAKYPMRHKRDVWIVPTQAYSGSHFATFPEDLIEPCILAGSPLKCCPVCRAPYIRVMQRVDERHWTERRSAGQKWTQDAEHGRNDFGGSFVNAWEQDGWELPCNHNVKEGDMIRSIVLDPFAGTATVGRVCIKHGREFVGLDIDHNCLVELAKERTTNVQMMLIPV